MANLPLDFHLTFGKHRGKRYSEVRELHPEYIEWARGQNDANGGLKQLLDYCNEMDNIPADRSFTFGGKHRGEMFSNVFRSDPGYVEWALQQKDIRNPELKVFVEYCTKVKAKPQGQIPPNYNNMNMANGFGQQQLQHQDQRYGYGVNNNFSQQQAQSNLGNQNQWQSQGYYQPPQQQRQNAYTHQS